MAQSLGAIFLHHRGLPHRRNEEQQQYRGGDSQRQLLCGICRAPQLLRRLHGKRNGAPLYAVSVQNEPDATVTYESCFWNAVQFRTFMRNNAPANRHPGHDAGVAELRPGPVRFDAERLVSRGEYCDHRGAYLRWRIWGPIRWP